MSEDDEAPFELINCLPQFTEVIYSSKLGNKQVGSFIETPMEHVITKYNPKTGEYSDMTEMLLSGVTTTVKMISYILMAFVAISLISGSNWPYI